MPKQWELTVDSRLKNLATIADFVVEAAQAADLNEKATFEVQMAVDEACTNVIKHSYRGEENGKIAPVAGVRRTISWSPSATMASLLTQEPSPRRTPHAAWPNAAMGGWVSTSCAGSWMRFASTSIPRATS